MSFVLYTGLKELNFFVFDPELTQRVFNDIQKLIVDRSMQEYKTEIIFRMYELIYKGLISITSLKKYSRIFNLPLFAAM